MHVVWLNMMKYMRGHIISLPVVAPGRIIYFQYIIAMHVWHDYSLEYLFNENFRIIYLYYHWYNFHEFYVMYSFLMQLLNLKFKQFTYVLTYSLMKMYIVMISLFFKSYYPLTKFYTHLILLYSPPSPPPSPQQEVLGTLINLATVDILSFGHVMVLRDVDDIIRAFWLSHFGLYNYIMIWWYGSLMYVDVNYNIMFWWYLVLWLRKLINEVGFILNYFGSTYFTYLQVGNVINIGETLPNFWQNPY